MPRTTTSTAPRRRTPTAPDAARARRPRRTSPKAVARRPRLVEDDLQVDQAEHEAQDAQLLDLLDRISA